LALLGELGVNAYRFSVAWPRIQPDGSGPANARGLDFYDRLVDALTERGISPVPTLFHWDLPQTLEDAGGWLSGSEFPDGAAYIRDGDLEIISTPIDALGINYYNPTRIGAPAADAALPFDMLPIEGVPITAFGWPVVPTGLRDLLVGLRERYNAALPIIYITESGCSTVDVVDADGRIHDTARIDYLEGHLRALHQAIAEGVDVRGYFVWSLLDNFEWAEGYHQRFGLVRVDYDTLRRTPKDSFHWLRAALAGQS
jgi:beta-glucosidase